MKTKNLAIIMSAVPIAAIGVDQAAAQGASDSVFEEIVVTAQKREQSIYDVPVAISAFTPKPSKGRASPISPISASSCRT